MLTVVIPKQEYYDEQLEEFREFKGAVLQMEHSLVSISKWESKYKRPFLKEKDVKTQEETLYYLQCMTITQNVDPSVFTYLTKENMNEINDYIHDSHTATTFSGSSSGKGKSREIMTSELLYYYLFSCGFPIECQKWHINRLLTLIHIYSIKNDPKGSKKMGKNETLSKYRSLNAARRAKYGTKG